MSVTQKLAHTLVVVGMFSAPSLWADWVNCKVTGVGAFASRMHVRCSAPVGGISYFAIPTNTNGEFFRTSLAVANASLVAGKTLKIMYNPGDTSGAAYGCSANDCRAFQGLEMVDF